MHNRVVIIDRSPYSQQQLSAGSETTVPTLRFEDPLRARAEKLDPLEAAVDIFDR